jgi:hypothetical protein
MDPELTGCVNDAVAIASSGRWAAVNARIVHYAGTAEVGRHWHFPLFSSLCFQVFNEYLALKKAYYAPSTDDLSLIAWRTRNLLELKVWTVYFCRSERNARRIYEDAGRDGRDIFSALAKWGKATAQPDDWATMAADANTMLLQRASEVGIDDLDGSYKAVRDAAQECGLGDDYALQFKVLSKFAHPTAFQMMAPAKDTSTGPFRDAFFSQGCGLFTAAFVRLEAYLGSDGAPWKVTGE